MAWDSRGYDGTVNEPAWAALHRVAGTRYGIESGWVVTGVAGGRLLNITAGKGWGWGVFDTTDADETITVPANSTGSVRWDTVVVRRNWSGTAGTSSFAVLTGGTSKAVASGIASNGGVLAEQPIALIPVPSGATSFAGIAVVPLRLVHPGAVVCDGDVDPPAPWIGQVRYTTAGRQAIWDGARWLPIAGDTPYARGEVFPGADFTHSTANYIYKTPLTQSSGHAYGGARVESGRLVVPSEGLYRVAAKQRFHGTSQANVALFIRAGSGGSSSGGVLVDASFGTVGPSQNDLTLVCNETVYLNAGGYVEVFRQSSTAGTVSTPSTASITLERK